MSVGRASSTRNLLKIFFYKTNVYFIEVSTRRSSAHSYKWHFKIGDIIVVDVLYDYFSVLESEALKEIVLCGT